MVELTIIGHTLEQDHDNKEFVSYHIRCREDDVEWTLQRRYSEFHSLHKQLSKYFSKDELPKFPPKLLFGNMKRENVIKRKIGLEMYMRDILSSENLYDFEDVHLFLETKKYVKKNITQAALRLDGHGRDQGMSKESDFIKAERCRVLYAYSRQDETELDLQEGDIVIVTQEDDNGWWYGHVESQESVAGFFPSNYVAKIAPSEGLAPDASVEQDTAPVAVQNAQMSIAALITKSLHTLEDKEQNGSQPISSEGATLGSQEKRAIIMYDYLAEGDQEITVREGDIIQVLVEQSGNGWSHVRLISNGQEGFIPHGFYEYK